MGNYPKIKVIGVGGAGGNILSRFKKCGLEKPELFVVNTDVQALRKNKVSEKILVGKELTGGLGAGMDWKVGEKAIKEDEDKIKDILEGAEIVFLVAGLGGGSGSPAIPMIGKVAKDLGILTLDLVTLPFSFEGSLRKRVATKSLKKVKKNSDSFLVVPNDNILEEAEEETTVEDAFHKADETLVKIIKGISNLLLLPGIISVDFADLEEIIKDSGKAFFGEGKATGGERAVSAARQALSSSYIDFPKRKKSSGVIFGVRGHDIALFEVNKIANYIKDEVADSQTKIIFGVSEDKDLKKGELKVTLMAAGIK